MRKSSFLCIKFGGAGNLSYISDVKKKRKKQIIF